ncbi:unnamed protein product [Polarella glacialis]|uniref:Uncharacterized protein n=1 Tax=Polarella glacialis TaxID=89957 RepID=A0A813IC54_POLGL|nr:unnamed protein product [Polarella glacialis]CAE8647492.1 unnamed protein product [Polarella glacialis]
MPSCGACHEQRESCTSSHSWPSSTSRSWYSFHKLRHLEVCYFLVQEMVRRKLMKTYNCKGTANAASFLTKHASSPAAVQEALPALGMIFLNEVSLQEALRDAWLVKVSTFKKLAAPWKPRRAAAASALQLSCVAAALSKAAAAANDYEGRDDSLWLYLFTALAVVLTYLFWNVSQNQQKLQQTLQQQQQQHQQRQQPQTEPTPTPAAATAAAPAAATAASESAATAACAPTVTPTTTPAPEAKTFCDRATDTRAAPAARFSRARRVWRYAISSAIRQLRRRRQWSSYGTFLQKASQKDMWSGLTRVSGRLCRTKPSASWELMEHLIFRLK